MVHWLFAAGILFIGMCLLCEVIVAESIGSLNTTTRAAFTGTSVFLCGGSVRITIGGRLARTSSPKRTLCPLESVTTTITESPGRAGTGTGSMPPSLAAATSVKRAVGF